MKAERRHNLKSNELADSLGQLTSFLRQHGSKLLAGLLLVVLALAVGLYLYRSGKQEQERAWQQLVAAVDGRAGLRADDLERLAEQAGDKDLAAYAWLQLGDQLLNEYLLVPEIDRTSTAEKVERASKIVADNYGEQKLIAVRAKINLGILYEDLGRWDSARQIYQELAKDGSLGSLGFKSYLAYRTSNLDTWQRQARLATTMPATNPTTAVAQ